MLKRQQLFFRVSMFFFSEFVRDIWCQRRPQLLDGYQFHVRITTIYYTPKQIRTLKKALERNNINFYQFSTLILLVMSETVQRATVLRYDVIAFLPCACQ